MINQNTLDFLKKLAANNNREWFQENKNWYVSSHENVLGFTEQLIERMKTHDHIVEVSVKKVLFRIYRDIRFSKDKTPYKTYFAGRFQRESAALRGGYYFRIAPGESFIAAGFWGPSSADIKLIRQHISAEPERIEEVVNQSTFKNLFGTLEGERLKKIPRGFDKEDPAAEWLKMKQLIATKQFTDKEVTSTSFLDMVDEAYQGIRPFFNYMSEILTTDLNGESLLS